MIVILGIVVVNLLLVIVEFKFTGECLVVFMVDCLFELVGCGVN